MTEYTTAETLEPDGKALQPAFVRVELARYIAAYPAGPMLTAGCVAAALALWPWLPGLPAIVIAVAIYAAFRYRRRAREHFRRGRPCPGLIVSADPILMAVYVEPRLSEARWPAIQIVPLRRGQLGGRPPKLGQETVAVAAPHPKQKQPLDFDLDPKPIECATLDEQVRRRLHEAIPDEHWLQLADGLEELESPFQAGLFPLGEAVEQVRRHVEQAHGFYRDGDRLYIVRGSACPDLCVICNRPAQGGKLKVAAQTESETSSVGQGIGCMLGLANPLLALLVWLAGKAGNKAKPGQAGPAQYVGLCRRHAVKRRLRRVGELACWTIGITSTVLALGAAAIFKQVAALFVAAVFLAGTILLARRLAFPLKLKQLDSRRVVLVGVHPYYLRHLPPLREGG